MCLLPILNSWTFSVEIFQMDWNVPEVHSFDLSESKMHRIQIVHKSEYRDKDPAPQASDCLPTSCYRCFPCCINECSFIRIWTKLRTKTMMLLTSFYFVGFVMAIIVVCCFKIVSYFTFYAYILISFVIYNIWNFFF